MLDCIMLSSQNKESDYSFRLFLMPMAMAVAIFLV